MKTSNVVAMVLVTLASFPLAAQQAGASAQQNTSASAGKTHISDSSNVSGNVNANSGPIQANGTASNNDSAQAGRNGTASSSTTASEISSVNGELVGKLDTKSAKAGDQVVVKTTQSTKTADGTVIPKGTKLVGHVTSVQAHGKGSADSQMGIQFDRAELKGGQSLPIQSEIRSILPSAGAMAASSLQSDDSFGGGEMMAGGGGRAMGGAHVGGGGLVGGAGGSVHQVADTTSRAGSNLGAMTNETARTTGHVARNAAGTVGGVGHASGSLAGGASAHATGIPGVMLGGDANGRASGMLSASKENVHLESGTRMQLSVAPAR